MLRQCFVAVALAGVLMTSTDALAQSDFERVTRSEVTLQPLNPLRGDASPQAGVLWGDIARPVASGTLVQFRDGFSSPPHIHNITYRAVVISGAVHNDDPAAAPLWMGPGSFWTQPAGETHITAAQGENTTIFLEILDGPYLVQPSDEAFDNGERPVDMEARNIVWLGPSDISWVDHGSDREAPEMAFLWGEPKSGARNGTFLRLPAGYQGALTAKGEWLRAVVIQGDITHQPAAGDGQAMLEPGSYFGGSQDTPHLVDCAASEPCTLYVTAEGTFALSPR